MFRGYGFAYPHQGGDWGSWEWVTALLLAGILIASIVAIILLARALRDRGTASVALATPGGTPPRADAETLRILDERYARGDLSRDDYLQRRDDLAPTVVPTETAVAGTAVEPVSQVSPTTTATTATTATQPMPTVAPATQPPAPPAVTTPASTPDQTAPAS